jgi:hypothetical protein
VTAFYPCSVQIVQAVQPLCSVQTVLPNVNNEASVGPNATAAAPALPAVGHSGYREIQNPPKRYGIMDPRELSSLCGFSEIAEFQKAHRRWVDDSLTR